MMKLFSHNGTHYGLIQKHDGWYIHAPYFGVRHKLDSAPQSIYPKEVIIKAKRIISEQEKQTDAFGQCKY